MQDKKFIPADYWENRLNKISGLEGVGFKKLGAPFNKWAYKVRGKVFLKQVSKFFKSKSNLEVLDIGSGTGFYIDKWEVLHAKEISGVDISNTAIENLKVTFPQHHFFQSDIGQKSFNDKNEFAKYDCISAMDVLFHIVDDEAFDEAISNISSLLKPGGYFIYSDNFMKRKAFRGESQACRTNDYLMALFEKNNLSLEVFKPFMYLTNSPIDTRNPILKLYWFLLENGLYVLPFMGHIVGPLLYPIEMACVSLFNGSPTTKFVVLKKK